MGFAQTGGDGLPADHWRTSEALLKQSMSTAGQTAVTVLWPTEMLWAARRSSRRRRATSADTGRSVWMACDARSKSLGQVSSATVQSLKLFPDRSQEQERKQPQPRPQRQHVAVDDGPHLHSRSTQKVYKVDHAHVWMLSFPIFKDVHPKSLVRPDLERQPVTAYFHFGQSREMEMRLFIRPQRLS